MEESFSENEEWVTIAVYTHPHDCYVPAALLQTHNIVCFLKDEYSIQSNELWSHALGGIKLQVRSENKIQASELLVQHQLLKSEVATISERTSNFWEVKTYTQPIFIVILLCILALCILSNGSIF